METLPWLDAIADSIAQRDRSLRFWGSEDGLGEFAIKDGASLFRISNAI